MDSESIPELNGLGVFGSALSPDGIGNTDPSGLGEYMPQMPMGSELSGRRRPYTPEHLQAPPTTSALAQDAQFAPAPLGPPAPPPETKPPAKWPTGVAVVAVAGGAAIGGFLGGGWGLAAGALMAGAARNLCRAGMNWASDDPAKRAEAAKSGTVGVVGLGIGAWLAYKAVQSKREQD